MILRSRYLVDSTGRAIENAEVAVESGRIASVRARTAEEAAPNSEVLDLGHAVILPGLVNAHTHLELTNAHAPVAEKFPFPGQFRFTDWIREVVLATSGWTHQEFDASLREGVRLSVEAGTTSIGDIGGAALGLDTYCESGMRARLFREVIGFDPSDAGGIVDSLKAWIDSGPSIDRLARGISPHTPYTVSRRLLRGCAELAHEKNLPLCIHLAETEAELEFLSAGTGEILEFREEFGLWSVWKPPRVSPVRYLHHLGLLDGPTTLVHCNYVGESDFDMIAMSGSSVVFCPRSHAYFGHRAHPFLKMLGHGINVALGTDSLISSPSLSILDEIKFLRREYPEVEPAVLLRMATTNGAKALGLPVGVGGITPGSPADLVAVALPQAEAERFDGPLEAAFSKGSEVILSMADGEILRQQP